MPVLSPASPMAPRVQRVTPPVHVFTLPVVRELPAPAGHALGSAFTW
jgi:hypothetical protein